MTSTKPFWLSVRSMSVAGCEASFATGVGGVVSTGAELQMGWAYASPHIASVKHFETRRNLADGEFPCCSVGVDKPAAIPLDLSVTAAPRRLQGHDGPYPDPALAQFRVRRWGGTVAINMSPETLNQGNACRGLRAGRRTKSVGVIDFPSPIGAAIGKSSTLLADKFHSYLSTRGLSAGHG